MINISSHDLFFTYSCCTKAGSSESVEWENNRRRSQRGLSRLGIICASFTPHHLRGTRYNATFARGETWWRRQGSARRPQEFGIHKIFVRHLRNVQMMPKWRPNDRPLVSFKEDTVRMFPRLIFVVFVEQGSIQHKVDHFLPPPLACIRNWTSPCNRILFTEFWVNGILWIDVELITSCANFLGMKAIPIPSFVIGAIIQWPSIFPLPDTL